MSFSIGGTALPRFPEKILFKEAADIKTLGIPSMLPLLLVKGDKADVLVITGRLQVAGQTKANLTTNYINVYSAMKGTNVAIVNAGRSYTGTNFLFAKFDWDEMPGEARTFRFRMEFWKGSTVIVI